MTKFNLQALLAVATALGGSSFVDPLDDGPESRCEHCENHENNLTYEKVVPEQHCYMFRDHPNFRCHQFRDVSLRKKMP